MAQQQNNTAPGLAYGRNAVSELLQSEHGADTVYIAEGMDAKTAGYLTALAKQAGAAVKRVPAQKLDALCNGQPHQGVAASAALVNYCSLPELLQAATAAGQPPFLLLCDGVQDPHNLGALLRSALLCGVTGAVVTKRGAPGITPVVMKSSAGAAAHLPVARVANLGEAVRRLKQAGVFVYYADATGPPAENQNLRGAIALVMGGEEQGVAPLVRKLCDGAVGLAMAPTATGVDSFNVSVAGGILMYEIFRQRGR